MIEALLAKSNAGDNADVIVWADPATHRLLVNASVAISGGNKSNNAAAPTSDNLGVLPAVANAAAPTYTEGNQVLLSTDLSGQLRVTGSLSVGGTTDGATFTAGSSTGTPAMGAFHSVIDTVTDGKSAIIAIDSKRAMHTSLYDAAGNALLGAKTSAGSIPVVLASDQASIPVAATLSAETTKVIGTVRNLGNVGAIFDGVNTAATAPANGILGLGIFNSTEPSPTTGQSVGIQLDSKGRQRMVIMDAAANTRGLNVAATGNISIDAVTTVTTVTAVTAITNALPAGTNLMGKVGIDQTTVGTTNGISIAQIGANTVLTGNGVSGTGSQRVNLASDNSALPAWGHGAIGSAVPAGAQYKGLIAKTANPTAATDGNLVGAMADKLGRQVVVIGNVRDNKADAALTLTASTSETTVIAAVASTFLDVYGAIVVNTSATACEVVFRDVTAGTPRFSIQVPAGETRGFMLPSSDAYKQATVNTAWTAQCGTSVSSIKINLLYVKNL